MEFHVNHPVLYLLAGILILAVLGQSVFFLLKALKRSKEIGMDQAKIKKTIQTAAVFTIAPAVSVLVGVVVLSKALGIALPWLRLSVIGSITYENVAAQNALTAAGLSGSQTITDPSIFVTVLFVMTVGIAAGLVFVPFVTKGIQGGMNKIGMKDKRWAEIFNNAMFLGMISAFLGYVFCDVSRLWNPAARVVEQTVDGVTTEVAVSATSGLIPVCVMGVSAFIMLICGLLIKLPKMKWLSEYALPISLVLGMAAAIPVTAWLS